jgi:outer membrane protein OmpA-like peptidoglycan-associated protein
MCLVRPIANPATKLYSPGMMHNTTSLPSVSARAARPLTSVLACCGALSLGLFAGCQSGSNTASTRQRCPDEPVAVAETQPVQQAYVAAEPAPYTPPADNSNGLVGPRGPDGATGATGATGETGATGAPGLALAGERGADGATGATGAQGATGATGASGELRRGAAGRAGNTGATGATGNTGAQGAIGASTAGYAGAQGATGATGAQGNTGATGAQGSTTYGPSGAQGATGGTGAQGSSGNEGSKGSTTAGVAGATGATGATGSQGSTGSQGGKGVAGIVGQWTSYRDYNFSYNDSRVSSSDAGKTAGIAAYMKDNPSLQLGLDGTMDPNGSDPKDQALRDRRVDAVRSTLIDAGVPAYRIKTGAFGDPSTRSDRRVEVLFATAN